MPVRPCLPVPFFGPLARAKIITIGLNPSTGEFAKKRNWSRVTEDELPVELVNYWNNERRKPHSWFQPWETVLSELGVSYTSNAAHIDLSPRATNCRKRELRSLFISMLQTDAPIWIEALCSAPNCKLVLAAGSATNDATGFINEFISNRLPPEMGVRLIGSWSRRKGAGQTAHHTISIRGGPEIPFFFCSTGPSSSGPVLLNACRENMGELKQRLAVNS